MTPLLLILRREYNVRVRKPSFWVLTLLIPLVLAALYALPVVAAHRAAKEVKVLVVDQTGLFAGGLCSTDAIHFHIVQTLEEAEQQPSDAILFIPLRQTTIPHDAFLYYQRTEPSLNVQTAISNQLQQLLRNAVLEDVYHLQPSVYHSVESAHIALHTRDKATGHESFSKVKRVVSIVLALLMSVSLLLFCVQTMRAVQEEKQNRTAEVLATSVSPLMLLSGKLLAIVLVALTQLLLWIILTSFCIKAVQHTSPDLFADAQAQMKPQQLATRGEEATAQYATTVQMVDQAVQGLTAIRLPLVAGLFVLYFVLGYLLYGSLLAALASRLDSDADALQWSLLLLSPLWLALLLLPLLITSPLGMPAQWLTILPFTAPVAALARLPFALPTADFVWSLILLLFFIAVAALIATKSYRRHLC